MSGRIWFKIGEVAEKIGVTPKELRYWEQVIPELRPRRSQGNLRYYHAEEMPKLEKIRQWLKEGYTVSDCRDMLKGVALQPRLLDEEPPEQPEETGLAGILAQLRALRDRLAKPPVAGQESQPVTKPMIRPVSRSKGHRAVKKPKVRVKARLETPMDVEKDKGPKVAETRGRMFAMLRLPKDWKG